MEDLGICVCGCEYRYLDNNMVICPVCNAECSLESLMSEEKVIKDANGNVLSDGDAVITLKTLKVKGSSDSIKIGTKVKNIRLDYNSSDDHDINCKIEGFGAMKLKSSVVKKA